MQVILKADTSDSLKLTKAVLLLKPFCVGLLQKPTLWISLSQLPDQWMMCRLPCFAVWPKTRAAARCERLHSVPILADARFASQVAKFQEPLVTKRAAQPVLREIDSRAASVQEDDAEARTQLKATFGFLMLWQASFGEEPPAMADAAAAGSGVLVYGPR